MAPTDLLISHKVVPYADLADRSSSKSTESATVSTSPIPVEDNQTKLGSITKKRMVSTGVTRWLHEQQASAHHSVALPDKQCNPTQKGIADRKAYIQLNSMRDSR